MFGKEARVNQKILIDVEDESGEWDKIECTDWISPKNRLYFLHKNHKNEFVFHVRKLKGTGRSGICLTRDEFHWV